MGKCKNLMNRRQFIWKFQSIGNLTTSMKYFIGTHITRTQHPFPANSNHPFIGEIFKYTLSPSSNSKSLSYDRHNIFPNYRQFATGSLRYELSQSNQIETRKRSLSQFKPSNWRPTSSTIKVFRRSHGDG